MDDAMEIKQRHYDIIENHITEALIPYLTDKSIKLSMVRSGVTINDTIEIITLVTNTGMTCATFMVKRDDNVVTKVSIHSRIFDKILGIFELKDKAVISEYLNSFVGIDLGLYNKEEY